MLIISRARGHAHAVSLQAGTGLMSECTAESKYSPPRDLNAASEKSSKLLTLET